MFNYKKIGAVLLMLLGLVLFGVMGNSYAATLSLDKTSYASGETILATFGGGPNFQEDWVGIYPEGVAPGSVGSTIYLYVDGTCAANTAYSSGTLVFEAGHSCFVQWPLTPGITYQAYFMKDNGYEILAGPVNFDVTGPTFDLDKTSFYEGENITATYQGAPGNTYDWMGVYLHPGGGAPTNCSYNDDSVVYNYTYGVVSGNLSINTPIALQGNYVAHFLADNGYCDIAAPQTFSVVPSPIGDLSGPGGGNKVVMIGIDGVRPDTLAAANTPNIDALIANGAFDENANTVSSITYSGPGWSDIHTGVDEAKHNITGNGPDPDMNLTNWPSWLERLETEDPSLNTVTIVTWDILLSIMSHKIDRREWYNGEEPKPDHYDVADVFAKNKAVDILTNDDPDAMFVYLSYTDQIAHETNTTGPETKAAIETVDSQIGEIMSAIQNRSTYGSENWLIALGTDHGRKDDGSHGGNTPDEKWVFYLVSGTGSDQGTTISGASNVDYAPTILKHMLGSVNPAWGLDGQPTGLNTGGGCTATDFHVSNIVLGTQGAGGGQKYGKATATITDNCGNSVSSATVTGTFTGEVTGTDSNTTDGSGNGLLFSSTTGGGNLDFTFCVDSVVGSLTYNAANNVETCDSI